MFQQLLLCRTFDSIRFCTYKVPKRLRQLQRVHTCTCHACGQIRSTPTSKTIRASALTYLRIIRWVDHHVEREQREPSFYGIRVRPLVRRLAELFGERRQVRLVEDGVELRREPFEQSGVSRDSHLLGDIAKSEDAKGRICLFQLRGAPGWRCGNRLDPALKGTQPADTLEVVVCAERLLSRVIWQSRIQVRYSDL